MRFVATEPAACPTLTKGTFAYDYGDTAQFGEPEIEFCSAPPFLIMPWVVGIDEAGYGPNLGPLVQAAVILWMPPEDLGGWNAYAHCFRNGKD